MNNTKLIRNNVIFRTLVDSMYKRIDGQHFFHYFCFAQFNKWLRVQTSDGAYGSSYKGIHRANASVSKVICERFTNSHGIPVAK